MFIRKKQKKRSSSREANDADYFSSSAEFYSASPGERTLHDDQISANVRDMRKTGRHQKVMNKWKGLLDTREIAALVAIFRAVEVVLLLLIVVFGLKKGTAIYGENRVAADREASSSFQEQTPAMQAVELVENFDIQNQEARKLFAKRIEGWQVADRLVRSADALFLRGIYDPSITQCKDALMIDPSHLGALELLGKLCYAKKDYAAAVNVFARLMSVDPSRKEIQKKLIQALDAYGDNEAVVYMAEWYFDQNRYDPEIQRYLAHALYGQELFENAVVAFNRVLRDSPDDILAMEQLSVAYMQLGQYENALKLLETLRRGNYRNPIYYQQIIVCNAQLGRSKETVDALGRATQLFGEQMVLGLLQDPKLDPVREDPAFQGFADRIGGEEFRLWLEEMAKGIQADNQGLPTSHGSLFDASDIQRDNELLQLKK